MKIKIKYQRQANDYYCGPASVSMLLSFYDIRRSQSTLARHLHTGSRREGTAAKEIVTCIRRYLKRVHASSNASRTDLRNRNRQGVPILVLWTEPSENVGHYSVVTNIFSKSIELADPWNGNHFKISLDKFIKRWYSESTKIKRWMLVVERG